MGIGIHAIAIITLHHYILGYFIVDLEVFQLNAGIHLTFNYNKSSI